MLKSILSFPKKRQLLIHLKLFPLQGVSHCHVQVQVIIWVIDSVHMNVFLDKLHLDLLEPSGREVCVRFSDLADKWAVLLGKDRPNLEVRHLIVKNRLGAVIRIWNSGFDSVLSHGVVKEHRVGFGAEPIDNHVSVFFAHNVLKFAQSIYKNGCRINPNTSILLNYEHSHQICSMSIWVLNWFLTYLCEQLIVVFYIVSDIRFIEEYELKVMFFGNNSKILDTCCYNNRRLFIMIPIGPYFLLKRKMLVFMVSTILFRKIWLLLICRN